MQAATLGADVATIPAKVLRQMAAHPLTDAGIERFNADWAADPQRARWLQGLATVGASGRAHAVLLEPGEALR